MRISDWSSDVCSSDLAMLIEPEIRMREKSCSPPSSGSRSASSQNSLNAMQDSPSMTSAQGFRLRNSSRTVRPSWNSNSLDRKSVVKGKSVTVRLDPGGRRIFNKKQEQKEQNQN